MSGGLSDNLMSPKLKVGATVAVLLGFAAVLGVQQLKNKHLLAENADLRSQLVQMSSLQARNEGLAQQLKDTIAASRTNQIELLRLRGQGSSLRQLEQENAQLKSERQRLALQIPHSQAAVSSPEQGQVTGISEVAKATPDSPLRDTTDLGSLELQTGIAVHFDLGGGTNCTVTPTALSDGNNLMEIKVGVTNAGGAFSELGTSRLTARPGPANIAPFRWGTG
ncbi:MAG TPA: hypothetical protein VJA21_16605 [Verrucomicrobiae bacterium]